MLILSIASISVMSQPDLARPSSLWRIIYQTDLKTQAVFSTPIFSLPVISPLGLFHLMFFFHPGLFHPDPFSTKSFPHQVFLTPVFSKPVTFPLGLFPSRSFLPRSLSPRFFLSQFISIKPGFTQSKTGSFSGYLSSLRSEQSERRAHFQH